MRPRNTRWLFGLLLSLCAAAAPGQGKITDSLEHKLERAKGWAKVDILNQLTYEFISVDNDKVQLYSNQALKLSRTLHYTKGEGVAHTYRGVYEYLSGQFAEAHRSLHTGMNLSKEMGDKQNVGYSLLQLGNCSLEEVNMDSAFLFFTKAREIFKDSSSPNNLSKVYRNLSALYGQRFQQDSQQFYLDRSIVIRRLLPDKTLLVDALALQATNKLNAGNLAGAEVLLREAEEIIEHYPEDLENLHDVRHIRALILFQKGNFEEASVLFDSARNYYFKTSLLRKYVTLLTDLGKVFSDRGEYELALNNLYDALRLSQLRGFETETYIIRNRIGRVNYQLGDMTQALRLTNESLHSRPKKLLTSELAEALTLKGVVQTELRDFDEAKFCLDSAFRIYKRVNNEKGMSEILMSLAELETNLNHYPKALELYGESLKLAAVANNIYALALSNWGMGDLYFRLGHYAKAASYLDRSEEYCKLIHAHETLIRNYTTRRDLLAAQKRYEDALKFSMLASQLKDSIHHVDLARRFVNLEKIQEIEQRDRNIKSLQKDKQLADDKITLQESRLRQQYILLVTGFFCIALLVVMVVIYSRFYRRIKSLNVVITDKNKRIAAQASKLQEVNGELNRLYNEVSEQKEEIQAQANELTESNKSIITMNQGLERIIAQKTVELRSTNDELAKHNNELLQFSYTVSHNLRGPVARLLGLSTLAHSETDMAQARQWLSLINKTAGELDLIIRDLSKVLDLRNEPQQYRERVGLDQEWRQSVSLLQESLTGHEEIIANFNDLPTIITVRAMLQSILYNLLSNAIKYRSPDRNLRVTALSRCINGKAILEITDNGLGFNPQLHKEKLFKLYTRFHSHVEGRGLGLYLVKSQVDLLHGTIEVESTPGHGTSFRIVLPMVAEEVLHYAG
ncbi:ATP-binding protein [Chryseolinea lacunae]|uniref:histidine kinase n=1 Tax=Chryseolinea lacunae TaxID=2801331 RepID=A0ABS1KK84_9BACT|nr:ATP-binding protein [Chryseolinea lacunae]MBL0739860.1 hypothetical protein [Chryseolinea lacunae]